MKPEAAAFLDKARECLAKADGMLDRWPDEAGREAYLAGLHAAQALIVELTGEVMKRHRGVQRELARLTKDKPDFDQELRALPTSGGPRLIKPASIGSSRRQPRARNRLVPRRREHRPTVGRYVRFAASTGTSSRSLWNCISNSFTVMQPSTRNAWRAMPESRSIATTTSRVRCAAASRSARNVAAIGRSRR